TFAARDPSASSARSWSMRAAEYLMDSRQARLLGTTDLTVFPICLGGNPLGWTADERESFKILDAFVGDGGNFIDTADEYSQWAPGNFGGESETIIGRWTRA